MNQELRTVANYAKDKNISTTAVYKKIDAGILSTQKIDGVLFIDTNNKKSNAEKYWDKVMDAQDLLINKKVNFKGQYGEFIITGLTAHHVFAKPTVEFRISPTEWAKGIKNRKIGLGNHVDVTFRELGKRKITNVPFIEDLSIEGESIINIIKKQAAQ